ncbi:hypothetical protein J6590_063242 [Homalodisca vitripennis]|nr:hypothetical protein J6590_063242 [Homalodisca vitripennis]
MVREKNPEYAINAGVNQQLETPGQMEDPGASRRAAAISPIKRKSHFQFAHEPMRVASGKGWVDQQAPASSTPRAATTLAWTGLKVGDSEKLLLVQSHMNVTMMTGTVLSSDHNILSHYLRSASEWDPTGCCQEEAVVAEDEQIDCVTLIGH